MKKFSIHNDDDDDEKSMDFISFRSIGTERNTDTHTCMYVCIYRDIVEEFVDRQHIHDDQDDDGAKNNND